MKRSKSWSFFDVDRLRVESNRSRSCSFMKGDLDRPQRHLLIDNSVVDLYKSADNKDRTEIQNRSMSKNVLHLKIADERCKLTKNKPAEILNNGPALRQKDKEKAKNDEKEVTNGDIKEEKVSFNSILSWDKSSTNTTKSVRRRRRKKWEERSIPDKNQKTILHFFGNEKDVEEANKGKRKVEKVSNEIIGMPDTPSKRFRRGDTKIIGVNLEI